MIRIHTEGKVDTVFVLPSPGDLPAMGHLFQAPGIFQALTPHTKG